MATVTNWIDHLSASEVAGQVYPMVGSELWWVLAGIIFWIWWTVATASGEAEEQEKLRRIQTIFVCVCGGGAAGGHFFLRLFCL